MIIIGLGANLSTKRFGAPVESCAAALRAIEAAGVRVIRRSRWYRSAPVPPSDQPWFVNGVAEVRTDFSPAALLEVLHGIERDFGRIRRRRNEARPLDLDLLVYRDVVSAPGEVPVLPHPRLAERAFVLCPLAELAPGWRHPVSGLAIEELIGRLPPDQSAEPLPPGAAGGPGSAAGSQ